MHTITGRAGTVGNLSQMIGFMRQLKQKSLVAGTNTTGMVSIIRSSLNKRVDLGSTSTMIHRQESMVTESFKTECCKATVVKRVRKSNLPINNSIGWVIERLTHPILWYNAAMNIDIPINISITRANCRKLGYVYCGAYVHPYEGRASFVERILSYVQPHGAVFGLPSHEEDYPNMHGLYIPIEADKLIVPKLDIDYTLTPWNCHKRGYEFCVAERYDPARGFHDMADILTYIWDNDNWRLGKPPRGQHDYVGIYEGKGLTLTQSKDGIIYP
jgi:hypothetical protein